MVKILGQTKVGRALTPREKAGHALPRADLADACTACVTFWKNPSSVSFWYFGHNFLILTPIRPPFESTGFPFIPLQDCKRNLDLPPGFDGIWHTLR